MNETTHLLDYELRRNHTASMLLGAGTPADRARADLVTHRRRVRRHRLANRVRAVADRLDG